MSSHRQTPATTPYSTQSSKFDQLVTSPEVEGTLAWESGPISPFHYGVESSSPDRPYDDSKAWLDSSSQSYVGYAQGRGSYYHQPQQQQQRTAHRSESIPSLPSQSAYSSQTMAGLGIQTSTFENGAYPALTSSNSFSSNPSAGHQYQGGQYEHERYRSSSTESSMPASPRRHASQTMSARRPSRTASGGSVLRRSKSQTRLNAAAAASASGAASGGAHTKAGAGVGFVNFTPSDSRKILTGVAPSGSSKTKARREKEAADRRRRLGQAAARAVLEAGGDVAALEREGLLAYA